MEVRLRIYIVLLMAACLFACGSNTNLTQSTSTDESTVVGNEATLEVVTWNIEHFPKSANTIEYVANIVNQIHPDILCMQEISDDSAFRTLLLALPNYAGASVVSHDDWNHLGIVYDTTQVQMLDMQMIMTNNSRAFPRAPYVLHCRWHGREYYVIDNHLKASGDNVVDTSDSYDEEMRRIEATTLLHDYVAANLANKAVIMVGDMNDCIQEPRSTNVFLPLLDDDAHWLAADMVIAQNPNQYDYSYPSWPSHLDHVFISDELFTDFNHTGSSISVLKPDRTLSGGWSQYDENVSDHRPVALVLNPNQ